MKFIALIGRGRHGKIVVDHRLSFPRLAENSRHAGGAVYLGDEVPEIKWRWPTGTWFQLRRAAQGKQ